MTLPEKIKAETKQAMIKKDAVRLMTLRGVSAAMTSEAIAKKIEVISDQEATAILKRLVKQRKDSIDQFTKGGRMDLVESEQAELHILEEFLPATMPREEIKKIAEAVKAKMNFTDKSKLGMLVGAVMKEAKGMADGADVKAVVESLFS